MVATDDKHLPTILYVEDNNGDALLLEEALRQRGHAVELLVIDTGDKALRYLEIKNTVLDVPPPHCILMDSQLPAVAGTQLIKFIRNSPVFNSVPVYIFAPERQYWKIQQEAPVSRDSFLEKPNEWAQFLALADLLMGSASTTSQEGHGGAPSDLRK